MSDCMDYWEPTMGALELIVDCLPHQTQERINAGLQRLARAQEERGLTTASYYSRALSGEPFPSPKPRPNLVIVK